MDDFKSRLFNLLHKQSPKIPSMGFSDANYHFPQEVLSVNSKTATETDRPADQEILESIEAAYFSTREDFDICRFELGKLPELLDCERILQDFRELKQQHQVVSKKVLQLILENQSQCRGEFEQAVTILTHVNSTLDECRASRKQLNVAANHVTDSLALLANYRKRKLAQRLLDNLKMIKHLHNFYKRLEILQNNEDYAGAIIELKRCHKLATKYRHFSCVAALTHKLQETLENTDGQLDRVLAQTCLHFDAERYKKLLLAYQLLDRSEMSMIDNLHVHYITAIYNSSFNVVHSYVGAAETLMMDGGENSGKNPYKTLCQSVGTDVFIPCLIDLCKVLFRIVLSYHQLIKFHTEDSTEVSELCNTYNTGSSCSGNLNTPSSGIMNTTAPSSGNMNTPSSGSTNTSSGGNMNTSTPSSGNLNTPSSGSTHTSTPSNGNVNTSAPSSGNKTTPSSGNTPKLDHNLTKIWDDVQRKVSSLLLNADLASYKFEQFVQVLSVVHRLIQVGEEFCPVAAQEDVAGAAAQRLEGVKGRQQQYQSRSPDLQESIRKQSVHYFGNYHAQRLDELRIFLENEMWQVCPVRATFRMEQLHEFRALRPLLRNYKRLAARSETCGGAAIAAGGSSSNHSQDGGSSSVVTGNYLMRCLGNQRTPFDEVGGPNAVMVTANGGGSSVEDILASEMDGSGGYFTESSEDDEEAEELRRDFVEECDDGRPNVTMATIRNPIKAMTSSNSSKSQTNSQNTLILSNTTLSVLRQMGKYLQMSRLLKPIAYQIISCMNQLFDYYLYSVHEFFASDLTIASGALYSNELSATLKRIGDNLVCGGGAAVIGGGDESGRVPPPTRSPLVDLSDTERLSGLAERVVAVESVIFLANQYQLLRDFMEFLVPPNNKVMLQQFFNQNVASAKDLRKPVYMAVVAQAFDLRQILMSMSKINWDVKEVMSQHNAYIELILREVQIFTLRLEEVSSRVPLGSDVTRSLWESIAHIITHTLVQGFSEAKKCSPGGRALMQLDFTQFVTKFEKISGLKPVPHREYVENYVKAYYLPEMELETWIREHTEYSSKHLLGLVNCACQSNKKGRQRLLQVVEEVEKLGENLR